MYGNLEKQSVKEDVMCYRQVFVGVWFPYTHVKACVINLNAFAISLLSLAPPMCPNGTDMIEIN